jgi:virulence-associated protein VapD
MYAISFDIVISLKNIGWFGNAVRDIRACRAEDWSNFTSFFKEEI